MKQAVRSVKDSSKVARNKAKSSYKDVKLKFKDKDELKDDSSSTQSAPSSPTSIRSSTLPNTTPTPLTRNNTDISFGRVLKYERFDPPEERTLKGELSPDLEEVPRLEYNLMNDLEEIMVRNKKEQQIIQQSNPVGNILPPEPRKGRRSEERQSSLGDLISLETESSKVVFDPLMDNGQDNKHKLLERSSKNGSTYGHKSDYGQQFNLTTSNYGQQPIMSSQSYGQQSNIPPQSFGHQSSMPTQSYGQQPSMPFHDEGAAKRLRCFFGPRGIFTYYFSC